MASGAQTVAGVLNLDGAPAAPVADAAGGDLAICAGGSGASYWIKASTSAMRDAEPDRWSQSVVTGACSVSGLAGRPMSVLADESVQMAVCAHQMAADCEEDYALDGPHGLSQN